MSHTLTARNGRSPNLQRRLRLHHSEALTQRPYAWGRGRTGTAGRPAGCAGIGARAPAPRRGACDPSAASVLIKAEAMPGDGGRWSAAADFTRNDTAAFGHPTVGDDELQKDITGCIYEKGSLVKGTQARYRLLLRERDRDFFRNTAARTACRRWPSSTPCCPMRKPACGTTPRCSWTDSPSRCPRRNWFGLCSSSSPAAT